MKPNNGVSQAHRDLVLIASLLKNDAFNDFFLRRVKEKRDFAASQVLTGDLESQEREILRQKYLVYDEILNLVSHEEAVCQRAIEQHKSS